MIDDQCPRCKKRYDDVMRGVFRECVWMSCYQCGHVGTITFENADIALQFMRGFGSDSYFNREDHRSGQEASASD